MPAVLMPPSAPTPRMPEVLRLWLLMLNLHDASEVWTYLDENPHACDDMIEVLGTALAGRILPGDTAPGDSER